MGGKCGVCMNMKPNLKQQLVQGLRKSTGSVSKEHGVVETSYLPDIVEISQGKAQLPEQPERRLGLYG